MKKIATLAILLLLVLSIVACTTTNSCSEDNPDCEDATGGMIIDEGPDQCDCATDPDCPDCNNGG